MGDGPRYIEIIPDYFETSPSTEDSPQERYSDCSISCEDLSHTSTSGTISHFQRNSFTSLKSPDISNRHLFSYFFLKFRNDRRSYTLMIIRCSCSSSVFEFTIVCLLTRKKFRTASFMLRLFSLKGLRFTGANGEEKVELTAVELESLRSELKDVEEREAHLKAQMEHLDEILRCARLSGYLYMRTRWAALPGELPPIDDCDVDDWIPRFTVLQGPCLFFYLSSTDLSPLDSTFLSDIIEVDQLPSLVRENEEIWHCFYIVTRHGLRIECSSVSRIQVNSWLTALRADCKFEASASDSICENCDDV